MFPLFCLTAYGAFIRPDLSLFMGLLSGFPALVLLFMAILPCGKMTFGAPQGRFWVWWLKCFLAHFVLMWFFISGVVALFGGGPSYAAINANFNQIFTLIAQFQYPQWGATFPWGIYLAWAISICYFTYIKGGHPCPHRSGTALYKGIIERYVKAFVEGTVQGATLTITAVMFSITILLFAYGLFIQFSIPNHFTLPLITIMLLSLLGPVLALKAVRKSLRRWSQRQLNLARLGLLAVLFMVPFLVYIGLAGQWVMGRVEGQIPLSECYFCQYFILGQTYDFRIALMYWSWWVILTPLVGSWLAKISKGRSLRQMVFGFFSVPLVILILVSATPKVWVSVFVGISMMPIQVPLFILGGGCLICLVGLCQKVRNSSFLSSGFMPLTHHRPGTLKLTQSSKITGLAKMGRMFLMATLSVILLHALGGWYLIQFQIGTMALLVIYIVYAGMVSLIVQFFKDNVWRDIPHENISG